MLFWIHLLYKQKQGRKEREERRTWWMCQKQRNPFKACISFPIYGESCLADIGLCLYLAELPKSVQFESGQGRLPKAHSHGECSVRLHQGFLLQSPAAAQGGLLSPQLTEGPCQGYALQGWRRCLCICLSSEEEREPAQVSEGLSDCPAEGGVILGWEEAEGPKFCHSSGV